MMYLYINGKKMVKPAKSGTQVLTECTNIPKFGNFEALVYNLEIFLIALRNNNNR